MSPDPDRVLQPDYDVCDGKQCYNNVTRRQFDMIFDTTHAGRISRFSEKRERQGIRNMYRILCDMHIMLNML